MRKLRLASYWASACGGCDVAILDTNEHILDIAAAADIVFWPVAVDFKYSDLEAYEDQSIDVCLFHGAVRNSENEHLARLLRQKSRILVAFGSCAVSGGIPALANFKRREDILRRVYCESPSTVNPQSVLPRPHYESGPITLELPDFYQRVYALDDVVPVDYYLPGCPPTPERIREVVGVIVSGQLPPAGATVGAGEHSLCHECSRIKREKKVKRFYRPHEIIPDRENCLLEQGLVCLGPVTRGGCGARCIAANMACRGCYGPMPGIVDQGAKFISTLGSIVDGDRLEDAEAVIDQIVDPAGTFFRFSMAKSLLKGVRQP